MCCRVELATHGFAAMILKAANHFSVLSISRWEVGGLTVYNCVFTQNRAALAGGWWVVGCFAVYHGMGTQTRLLWVGWWMGGRRTVHQCDRTEHLWLGGGVGKCHRLQLCVPTEVCTCITFPHRKAGPSRLARLFAMRQRSRPLEHFLYCSQAEHFLLCVLYGSSPLCRYQLQRSYVPSG